MTSGQFAEAEKEYRAVLAIRERLLGPEHPDTLTSRNNLACVLEAQGNHAEAEKEDRRLLAIRRRVSWGRNIPTPSPPGTTWPWYRRLGSLCGGGKGVSGDAGNPRPRLRAPSSSIRL